MSKTSTKRVKGTSAAASERPATLRRFQVDTEEVFRNIDLSKSVSVQQWIPLIPGRGQIKLIPSHFLFSEDNMDNPRKTLLAAYEFRRASSERQKVLTENQQKLGRTERLRLSKRHKEFAALQEAVREGEKQWKDIAPDLSDAIQTRTRKRRRVDDTIPAWVAALKDRRQRNVDDVTVDQEPPVFVSPPLQTAAGQEQEPDSPEEQEKTTADNGFSQQASTIAGRGSDKAVRDRMAAEAIGKKSKHRGKTKLASKTSDAGDKACWRSLFEDAHRAVARANDSCFLGGDPSKGTAWRGAVLIEFNGVAETNKNGGRLKHGEEAASDMLVTITANTVEEFHVVFQHAIKAVKHKKKHGYTRIANLRRPPNIQQPLIHSVSEMIEARKKERSRNKLTPRSAEEISRDCLEQSTT
jgi:hypothetical protein